MDTFTGTAMSSCFYEKGLRFECQCCNYCCSTEPGYVLLGEDDVSRMSSSLGMDRNGFIDAYCRYVDMGAFRMLSLKEKDNYDCIFLCEKGCTVYNARPRQCMTYPFWAHVLESEETWNEEAKACPGIGKGRLHPKKEIEENLRFRMDNKPIMVL